MFNFLSLKPESFGLDFSDSSIRIMKLKEKGSGFEVECSGETFISPGVIINGEVKNEDELVKAVREALRSVKGNLGTNYVVASLPEKKAFLQVIKMPCLAEEDLKAAVVFEAENYIPLSVEEVYLDCQIVPCSDDKKKKKKEDTYSVLIAALPRRTVDPYFSVLKKAKLNPTVLEIESFSLARALIKDGVSSEPIAILDIGASRTAFVIFSGETLKYSFTIPISSKNFRESLSKNLKVEGKDVDTIKARYGLENKSEQGREVFDALTPLLTDLMEQIKKYLDYYKTHAQKDILPSDGESIKKILLSGAEANIKGLPALLSEQLGTEVVLGDPWVNVLAKGQKKISNFPAEKSSAFASAIGLALRGAKRE